MKTSANQCLSPLPLPWDRRRIPKTHHRPLVPLGIGSSPLERGQHCLDWIITAGFIAVPVFLVYRQVSRIITAYSGEFVPCGTPLGIPWNWAASPLWLDDSPLGIDVALPAWYNTRPLGRSLPAWYNARPLGFYLLRSSLVNQNHTTRYPVCVCATERQFFPYPSVLCIVSENNSYRLVFF